MWFGLRLTLRVGELHGSAGERLVHTRDRIDHGGLARTVRTDECEQLVAADVERHVLVGAQATELNGDVLDVEYYVLRRVARH